MQGLEKAERAKAEAEVQVAQKQAELKRVETSLATRVKELAEREASLAVTNQQLAVAAGQMDKLRTQILALPASSGATDARTELETLDGALGRAYVNSTQARPQPAADGGEGKPLPELIAGLYAATAAKRGWAYNEIMARHAANPRLVPQLLEYAAAHADNANGTYNVLVVLAHLNYAALPGLDLGAIRRFAESVRGNGERTAQRVDVLLERLPK
jgi:hypothetical protein